MDPGETSSPFKEKLCLFVPTLAPPKLIKKRETVRTGSGGVMTTIFCFHLMPQKVETKRDTRKMREKKEKESGVNEKWCKRHSLSQLKMKISTVPLINCFHMRFSIWTPLRGSSKRCFETAFDKSFWRADRSDQWIYRCKRQNKSCLGRDMSKLNRLRLYRDWLMKRCLELTKRTRSRFSQSWVVGSRYALCDAKASKQGTIFMN